MRILVLGYGNPGRQDDGLGPALAERVAGLGLEDVAAETVMQLNVEDAVALTQQDAVLFADASHDAPEPFACREIAPGATIAFTSHTVSPESVLAICEEHFGPPPRAWVLAIRGYCFDLEEGLTPQAQANLEAAVAFAQSWILACKERDMETTEHRKQTILIIDDDPDIRASTRILLEREGFLVGEAATGEEGLKTVTRIRPDAVIVDLMMEDIDSGSVVARKLNEAGFSGPIYMLSSAGDSVQYNITARELGLAGILQKPIDPKSFVSILKSKLKNA